MSAFQSGGSINTRAEYDSLVAAHTHTIIFFWAEWHDPSKQGGQMDSVFTALSSKYPSIAFAKIEAEQVATASVAETLAVSVVPTFVAVLSGVVWGRIEGANPAGTVYILSKNSTIK